MNEQHLIYIRAVVPTRQQLIDKIKKLKNHSIIQALQEFGVSCTNSYSMLIQVSLINILLHRLACHQDACYIRK